MATRDPVGGGGLRRPDSNRACRGLCILAVALTLLAPRALVAQELTDVQRQEGRTLVESRDLAADLASGDVERAFLWEQLERFAPSIERDEVAARVVLEASAALKGTVAPERRARLYLLWTRSVIATGQLEDSVLYVYLAGAELRASPGDEQDARELLELALDSLPEPHVYRYFFFIELEELARRAGELELAFDLTQRAEASLGADSRPDLIVGLWGRRAAIYISMGLPDLAEPLIEAALTEAQGLRAEGEKFLGVLLATYTVRADARLAAGRYDRLIDEVGEAMRDLDILFAELEGDPRRSKVEAERPKLLTRLGTALADKSSIDPAAAERARDVLQEALESAAISAPDRLNCELVLAYLALCDGRINEAERWIASARERDPSAYEAAVRGWVHALDARLARDRGADSATLATHRDRLSADVATMVAAWSEKPPLPGGQAFFRYGRRRFVVGELMELTMELDPGPVGELAALEILYEVSGAVDSLAGRLGGARHSFAEARARICADGAGALIYFVGKDRSHAFALDAEHVLHIRLPGEWPLVEAMRDLELERLRAAGGRELERRAAELGGLLLPTAFVERVDGWPGVTIVGGAVLDGLPFELLPCSGETLGIEKAVVHLPSLALGGLLAERERSALGGERPTALCLAGGMRAPGYDDLLDRDAALQLAQPFGDAVDLLLDEQATLALLADGRLASARVLHLFTHGVVDFERERPSGLLFGTDSGQTGALWCDDVERLAAPSVVVLSACGAGRAPDRRGAVAHLGGAFLFAGADAVVLSDTVLRYELALEFAQSLHAALADGAGVAEAARAAREHLAVTRGADGRDHGARIRVIGLGSVQPVVAVRSVAPWSWPVAVLVFALVLLLARRRVLATG